MNSGDRHIVAYWIAQQKSAAREAEEAKAEAMTWVRRAQLAASKGETELAKAAQDKALDAHERLAEATKRAEVAKMEREVATNLARRTVDTSSLSRASQVMDNFRALGIDPSEAKFRDLEKRHPDTGALDELKARMGANVSRGPASNPAAAAPSAEPKSAASPPNPVDEAEQQRRAAEALSRLKAKMASGEGSED